MQDSLRPSSEKEIPSIIAQVPRSLQKYYQSIDNFQLIEPCDEYTRSIDREIQSIYLQADSDNRIGLVVQEYAPWCVVRPDLYIPLIVSSYKDSFLTELLIQHDPAIRGQIIAGAIRERGLLETAQAHFELGISGLNNLPQQECDRELQNITTQIAFLHNLQLELLSNR